jgi:uncharacterized surface protein with fasciclin (FAS1) repeats
VDALSASAANNRDGEATDRNPFDHDVLLAAAGALGLVPVLDGFTGTVFAPNDGAFRALVADLTNTPQWKLSEAEVLGTLVAIAGEADLNDTGVDGATALAETVKYHVTGEQIPNLRQRAKAGGPVDTITDLPESLSDGQVDLGGRFVVRLVDDDTNDRDPRFFGRTIATADGGTIHVINRVLRPLDLAVLFPAD